MVSPGMRIGISSSPMWTRFPIPMNMLVTFFRCLDLVRFFTGPRLKAAGISQSDSCQLCRLREAHEHLFCECPAYACRPARGDDPLLSWTSGIMVESQKLSMFRNNSSPDLSLPDTPHKTAFSEPIFVEGSCFYQKWKPQCAAASAVVIPALIR